jgi:hypothetical protein
MNTNISYTEHMRNVFESMVRDQFSFPEGCFELSDADQYSNPFVNHLWLGFLIARRYLKQTPHSKGNHLVAKLNEKGLPIFNRQPYIHRSELAATMEVDRLMLQHPDRKFAVYKCMHTRGEE